MNEIFFIYCYVEYITYIYCVITGMFKIELFFSNPQNGELFMIIFARPM